MPDIVLAFLLLLLIGGGWLFLTQNTKAAARAIRYTAVGALVLLGLFLAISGRAFLDLPIGAVIVWLTRGWITRGFPGLSWLKAWLDAKPYAAEKQAGSYREEATQGHAKGTAMTKEEALQVLGLEPGASQEAIRAAHRNLIMKLHPDHGGNSYLARQINTARDFLLNN